jgi:uncharacterized membrane protein
MIGALILLLVVNIIDVLKTVIRSIKIKREVKK